MLVFILYLLACLVGIGFSTPTSFSINSNGYFTRDGEVFVAAGVNYWPASTGVQMWNFWPEEEIQHDLDVIKSLGLNTLRFFLLWDQFEPVEGNYNETAFELLDTFLGWVEERELVAHVSPFVGWMSGGYFWPSWKGNMALFADPIMINRSIAYATKVASVAAKHVPAVLAMEYGNELDVTSDVNVANNTQILAWCKLITEAYKSTFVAAGEDAPLVVAGTDRSMAHDGFPLGQVDIDFTSVHEYPEPGWHPIQDWTNVSDPLSQHLMAGYAAIAKAYTPVMIQEFGIIILVDDNDSLTYLQNTLPLAWAHGANGFMWWCLRDIIYNGYPYNTNPIEHHLGLVFANDTVKPGYEYYVSFANDIIKGAVPIPPSPSSSVIGIYWPSEYYFRDTINNPGNNAGDSSRRALILLLQLEVVVVREDQLSTTNVKTLIIPCYAHNSFDIQTISAFVEKGGNVIWSGISKQYYNQSSLTQFIGASPSGSSSSTFSNITMDNQSFILTTFKDNPRTTFTSAGAKIIASDQYPSPNAKASVYSSSFPFIIDLFPLVRFVLFLHFR